MAGKKDKRAARDKGKNIQEDSSPGDADDVTSQPGVGASSATLTPMPPPADSSPPRHRPPSKKKSGAALPSSAKNKRQKTKVGESSSAQTPSRSDTANTTGRFPCPQCSKTFTKQQGLNGHMHYHNKVRIDGLRDGFLFGAEGPTDGISQREQAKQNMIAAANHLLSKLTKDDYLPNRGPRAAVEVPTVGGGGASSSSAPAPSRVVPTRTHLEFDIFRRPRDGAFTSARLRLELDFDVDPPLDDSDEPELGFDMNQDPPLDPESGFDANDEPPPQQ